MTTRHLLAADATRGSTENANYHGALATAITFRAWEAAHGRHDQRPAFSTATDTASLVVNPVADTPSVTNATTNEDAQRTPVACVISRNMAESAEVTHFKITGIGDGTSAGTTADADQQRHVHHLRGGDPG